MATAAPLAPGAPRSADDRVSKVRPVTGPGAKKARERVARDKKVNEHLIEQARTERRVSWPKPVTLRDSVTAAPSNAVIDVSAVERSGEARQSRASAAGEATITVLDQRVTGKAGITGVLFTAAAQHQGVADITVDYGSFASAVGGNWSARLGLVRLPACVLTSPEKAACRTATPVASTNDIVAEKVRARTTVAPRSAPMVMALTASATSSTAGGGDLKATPLSASSSWEAGGSSGAFTWSYPITLPPAAAGPVPPLSLSYDSGSIDGRTANTNNQGSQIGEGFSLTESYIERKYGSCQDDGQKDKYDQCWKYENASLVLNGTATELVKDDTSGKWRLKNDDASQVRHLTGADNGDEGDDIKDGKGDGKGEHWQIVTGDGTTYTFGLDKLPGADTQRTQSTWGVPVFGDDSGEPGHSSGSAFADRAKTQAWRWNLDLVQDVHGNAATYWYAKESNHYAQNGVKTKLAPYDRGGYLKEIRYGQRAATLFTGNPSGKVEFTHNERCTAAKCDELTKDTADNWPDVPFDSICTASEKDCLSTGPSFFSRKRVATIETHVWSTAAEPDAFKPVDSYALTQEFFDGQDIGNSSDQVLALTGIKRTGLNGTAISLPAVGFTYTQRPNRVAGGTQPGGANILPLTRPRLSTITSESGAITTVVLSIPECVRGSYMPKAEDDNGLSCYPVHWPVNGGDSQLDWFHKYRVTSINVSDPAAKNPAVEYAYEYEQPGWHYNDDPFTKEKERTWSVWRGYQRVTSYTGEAGATRSKSVQVFMQGMHGDKRKEGANRSAEIEPVALPTLHIPPLVDHDRYAGQLRQQVAYDGNTPVSASLNTFWSKETASQQKSYAHVKAHYIRPERSYQYTWLTTAKKWRTTASTTAYDDTYGMATRSDSHGDWEATGDETCTRTWYARNADKGLTSLVSRTRTVGKPCVETDDRLDLPVSKDTRGDVISDAAIVFDDPKATGWTEAQTPALGLPTWTGQPKGYPAKSGTADRDPAVGDWQTIAVTTFDTATAKLGRPLTVTDAAKNVTTTAYYPANTGPLTGVIVTHPKPAATAAAHRSYTYFDPARGSVTYTLDANLKRTEHAHDALGRVTATWLSNRSRAGGDSPNGKYAYGLSQTKPSWTSVSKLKADGTSYHTAYTIHDSLLRQVQTQVPAAIGTGRVLTDTRYDSRGLATVTKGDAYDSAHAPDGEYMGIENAQAPVQNDTVHDGVGRVVKSKLSSWGESKWQTTTTYTGDSVASSAVDGGSASRVITDALGRTTETRSYAGTEPDDKEYGAVSGVSYTTVGYTYTRDGKQKTVTGPDGTAWSYGYDLYGRQISATDPDKGTATTSYTVLDQVDHTKDAKGQTLLYGYDDLGRTTGLWQTSRSDASKLATWTFDAELKGKPDESIRHENGVNQPKSKAYVKKVTAYDSQSRPTATSLTLPTDDPLVTSGAVAATTNFSTSYRLDGTVNTTKEPAAGGLAAETVESGYNDAGLPVRASGISGYLLGVDYSATGRIHQLELGTSAAAKRVFVSNTYEAGTGRLLTSATDDQTRGPVQDLQYSYDPAGNVTSIFDRAGGDNQCFAYDGHRRLTEAWTPAAADCSASGRTAEKLGGPASYWTSYTFTPSGQRATEKQHVGTPVTTSYCYHPQRKHALKATTTSSAGTACDTVAEQYTYDATGNTETRVEKAGSTIKQSLEWNPEGKLAKLIEGTTATGYLYDADGNLLIRRDSAASGETVLYLGSTEVHLKSGKKWANRYYQAAGSTVAVRSNESGAEKLSFLAADHHGTSGVAITSDSSQTLSKRYTTPYGSVRGSTGTWPDDKGFLGKSTDSSTGLTSVGAREYDPSTGQFISVDPLLMPEQHQSLNGYVYANNNPTSLSDPSGLGVEECHKGTISCSGGIPDSPERIREKEKIRGSSGGNTGGGSGGKQKKEKRQPNEDGRSGSHAPGTPRQNEAYERALFTNAETAAKLRKERVLQILGGMFDLHDYLKEEVEEINEEICRRGARDGCAMANLAQKITDQALSRSESEVEKTVARIDESWRSGKDAHRMDFAFDDGEFQIALTLAIQGHRVTSRNDHNQPKQHQGDAWVDGQRTDFKAMSTSSSRGTYRNHLSKANSQQVQLVVVDTRGGGLSKDDAKSGFRAFDDGNRTVERVIVYGRGYKLDLQTK
ncbi:RHS repeat-associated core domain-containing protein [Streptomyces jumonjinensis]|uniref:RHS repeat-associated core domain-containing protein n=2 Tax=Streptomyces jumonjinensis TaxID=1945 RepID=A0A646KKP0_STRJU|nr:RHS repeat-associated core domain-containing protein [Streptomyces jumonjinensis]